jgi:uracil phosphoribosyltransferase
MRNTTIITKTNSIFNQFIAEIRDEKIQKDRERFKNNLRRIGQVFAYEISKKLPYKEQEVTSPLGVSVENIHSVTPVITTILRAGLPLQEGMLNFFNHADAGFISAYRNHKNEDEFNIEVEYSSLNSLDGRTLIITDTMIATGRSIHKVFKHLKEYGSPSTIHIVAAIASGEGLQYLQDNLPASVNYWIGAVDDELTAQSYIVPGLGDAGDLAFGEKE